MKMDLKKELFPEGPPEWLVDDGFRQPGVIKIPGKGALSYIMKQRERKEREEMENYKNLFKLLYLD